MNINNGNIESHPQFSIITVVKNCKNDIEETIQSVLGQNYSNFEYIVIDGGSTDGTREIIKKYKDLIDIYISEVDNGTYYAMNKGIRLARGGWLNFMNAGDLFKNSSILKNVSSCIPSKGADIIYGSTIVGDGTNSKLVHPRPIKKITKGRMVFVHQSSFVKRDIFKNFYFDEKYRINSDYNLFMQLYSQNYNFIRLDLVISIYKAGGLSSRYRFLSDLEKLQILESLGYPFSMIGIKLFLKWKIKEILGK